MKAEKSRNEEADIRRRFEYAKILDHDPVDYCHSDIMHLYSFISVYG